MITRRTQIPPEPPTEDLRIPALEDELEEAADLLPQQEPPETLRAPRPRPDSSPPDETDPSMIDPAD